MTIEIWIRSEDLENLKTIQGRCFSTRELAIQYSTVSNDDTQHCVHITYDEFVRLLDNELLIKL